MNCQQAMRRPVHTVSEDDTVREAARVMGEANIGFLPVCNESGVVSGVITDRDIVVRAIATAAPELTRIRDVMTRRVVSCRPTDPFFHAQSLMRAHRTSRVVCVDEIGRPVGVISFSEIARHEDGFRLAKTVRNLVGCSSGTFPVASVGAWSPQTKLGA